MASCPRCSAQLETPLGCLACGTLIPVASDASGRVEFEILGLAPAYAIDAADLRRRLLRFSRLTHPDYFATAGKAEKERAERATAMLNSAFALLSDDAARADHLVRMLGGPDENTERSMPKEFLMEVLEWNETLEAARTGDAVPAERLEELRRELEAKRVEALATVAGILEPLPASGAESLRDARRALNVVRYVDRALAELEALRLHRAEAR
jgi:molecular chaperone HscB